MLHSIALILIRLPIQDNEGIQSGAKFNATPAQMGRAGDWSPLQDLVPSQ